MWKLKADFMRSETANSLLIHLNEVVLTTASSFEIDAAKINRAINSIDR